MDPSDNAARPALAADLRVLVLGAGLMGHSIAGVFAAARAAVTVYDVRADTLASAPERIRAQLAESGGDAAAAERVSLANDLRDATAAGADLVIEAVPEKLDLKQELLAELSVLLPHAVLATNTSVFKIGNVARDCTDPRRVIGTHWWNPPHLIPLVEIIQAETTSAETAEWVYAVLADAGKVPVHVRKDIPGFIGNRLQHAMWREAISLVDSGVCDGQTVDLVVRNSFGLRLAAMGPIENADYVGLDLTAAVHDYLFPSLNRDDHASALLEKLIGEGHLGAKTGSGLLPWGPTDRAAAADRLARHLHTAIGEHP